MFLDNKYNHLYFRIIKRATESERIYDASLHERHHIVPRSLGGSNDPDNLVILTFREHYLCHRLLVKFTNGEPKAKMIFALLTFFYFDYTHRKRKTSRGRVYEYHKSLANEAMRHRIPTTKSDIKSFRHRHTGDEFVGTISNFRTYSGLSPQDVNMLVNGYNMYHIKNWGVFDPEEGVYSYEKTKPKPLPRPKFTCPHCGKQATKVNFNKWHGEKCKIIDPEGHNKRSHQISNLRISGRPRFPFPEESISHAYKLFKFF